MICYLLSALDDEKDRRKLIYIYEKYHNQMEKTAMRILLNQTDAEDAVQNAFMRIIEHFQRTLEIPCEELPFWIISIVKNEALMIRRKKRKTVPLEDTEDTWERFTESADDVQSYEDLTALFSRLPESYRSVLEMKLLIGYTDREIAGYLGISETAVSTRASRGRALLRKLIEKEGFLS